MIFPDFDLQSHRGGRGETYEESLLAFQKSLELGVSTLELDIVLSKDGVPMVWHDPEIQAEKCRDTTGNFVGRDVHELTLKELRTLACDVKLEAFPDQEVPKKNRMATLPEVFTLCASYNSQVLFNIETKIEADTPERSASPQEFVDAILDAVETAGVQDRVIIQSFDWRSLPLVKKRFPTMPTAALYDSSTWFEGTPWIAPAKFGPDVLQAIADLGADYVSPDHQLINGPEYIQRAHDLGLIVLPWTVNDAARMNQLMDWGVDGLITDFPTLLRQVMKGRGMELPAAYQPACA